MGENEGSILSCECPESSSPPVHISWEGRGQGPALAHIFCLLSTSAIADKWTMVQC